MNKLKIISALSFTLVLIFTQLLVVARGSSDVWVYDEDGDIREVFNMGEKLRIKAFDSNTPYKIALVDPDKNMRKIWVSYNENFDSGLLTFATDKMGQWKIIIGNSECQFTVGMFHVIPEMPLGILGTLTASFTALGLIRRRRK